MPNVGDNIRIDIVTELSGVQMQNTVLYKITNLGVDPAISVGLQDIVDEYYAAVNAVCATEWKIACAKYTNLTTPEVKQIGFFNLPGLNADDSHPQNQVLRVNMWGSVEDPGDQIVRSRFNQSGVCEEFSTRGRVNTAIAFIPLAAFLQGTHVFTPNWTVRNLVYGTTTRAAIPPPPAAIKKFQFVDWAQISPTFWKLASRRAVLCAP